MEFLELVKKRKSTRKYAKEPVPDEAIEKCLEAARLAPSACNSQPWKFIVVKQQQLRERVVRECFNGVYAINSFVKKANVLIVVVRQKSNYTSSLGGKLREVDFGLIDIGIACDHLTLQAEEMGIGSCWIGWFNEKALKKILDVSKKDKIDIVLSLGYPEEDYIKPKKRKTLEETREYIK
ncbi:MAG: nitroreductase family protein [Candidatus Marinimicrobia bacterium]|nr:nitroreductase family protein [Candidatus Neomarinimicrobiota bacterium]